MLAPLKSSLLYLLYFFAAAGSAISPDEIQARIDRQGGHKVLWALWENQTEWNQVLAGIESGNTSWLKLAQQLHPFSDAGASEELHSAVARALPKAPERVLAMIGPGFEIEFVCTSPFIEPEPGIAEAYECAALAALASVHTPKLQALVTQCTKLVKLSPRGA